MKLARAREDGARIYRRRCALGGARRRFDPMLLHSFSSPSLLLWNDGAPTEQQRDNVSVSPLPGSLERVLVTSVHIRSAVKKKPDNVQMACL